MTFVFRSTASTMVRCELPSFALATSGITWRRLGKIEPHAEAAVGTQFDWRTLQCHLRVGMSHSMNDHFGFDVETHRSISRQQVLRRRRCSDDLPCLPSAGEAVPPSTSCSSLEFTSEE